MSRLCTAPAGHADGLLLQAHDDQENPLRDPLKIVRGARLRMVLVHAADRRLDSRRLSGVLA